MDSDKHTPSAFSLVELSIVIVVLALVVGGITTGRHLIRASELRGIMTDSNNYIAAVNNFRQLYRQLPGDISSAESYWTAAATDNGNIDGQIAGAERFLAWQHLNLAGFIDKSTTGVQGAGGSEDFVIGGNTPAGKLSLSGYAMYYANMAASTTTYAVNLGNMISFGGHIGTNSGPPINAVLPQIDAYNIDLKLDDGVPATGKWIANLQGGGDFGTATACVTGTNASIGTYNTTQSTTACSFFIMTGF